MSPVKVLVIGSGLSAFGASQALINQEDLDITVFDIGLLAPYSTKQPNHHVPNAVTIDGSFYSYGLNDRRWPVQIDSQRICSSHAFGGFSTVYSGSLLSPRNDDLSAWPSESIPSSIDYAAIAEQLTILQQEDELAEAFPLSGKSAGISRESRPIGTFVGASRVAFNRKLKLKTPFNSAHEFQQWNEQGKIHYRSNIYVSSFQVIDQGILVDYIDEHCFQSELYDYLLIGAGCINTTTIVDRSLRGHGAHSYQISIAPILLQLHLRLAHSPLLDNKTGLARSRNKDLCSAFLEHYIASHQ